MTRPVLYFCGCSCSWSFAVALLCLTFGTAFSAEVIPPKPGRYFNDYAGVTTPEAQQELNRKLEALEKSDSTQIVVAVYPRMQSDSDIADYAIRTFENWGIGQKGTNNGAALFVFIEDRKMTIRTGYGLEGAIPDITAKDIIENRIKPHFRNNDFDAGLAAGVDALIQAARGEYIGSGRTVAEQQGHRNNRGPNFSFVLFLVILFLIVGSTRRKRGYMYRRSGRQTWGGGPIIWTGGTSGWGGGGGGWGGGGGFMGGGGSTGGGGASGSW